MAWEVIDDFHTRAKVFASDLNYAFCTILKKWDLVNLGIRDSTNA